MKWKRKGSGFCGFANKLRDPFATLLRLNLHLARAFAPSDRVPFNYSSSLVSIPFLAMCQCPQCNSSDDAFVASRMYVFAREFFETNIVHRANSILLSNLPFENPRCPPTPKKSHLQKYQWESQEKITKIEKNWKKKKRGYRRVAMCDNGINRIALTCAPCER